MNKKNKLSIILRLLIFVIIITGISLSIFYRDEINLSEIENWVNNAGFIAPVLFMLIYAIATIFFFPGSLLTLTGGVLFGPVLGTLYNLTGATLGATLAFLIARYLASDWASRKAAGKLKLLLDGVDNEGWRFVAFTRLVPLFPFNVLNYALGLTKIKFSHYLIATYTCMLPGAFAYTYLGYVGKEAATGGEGLVQKILLAIAFLVTIIYLSRWFKHKRDQSSKSTQSNATKDDLNKG